MIKNGVNGYLSDDDDELAEKICTLLDDKEKQKLMSRKSKEIAQKLMDIENYKKIILTEYKKWFKG